LHEVRVDEAQQSKWARKSGAILAPNRKTEGYTLPSGTWLTCLPDAVYNGLKTLDPSFTDASLAKLRRLSMPTLGNHLEASWGSVADALVALKWPYALVEATRRFQNAPGGPFLNVLNTPGAVHVVVLRVTVGGRANRHCVMVSTVPERHAPFGKLIDNHGKMVPVYLEKKDVKGKKAAHAAFCTLVRQHPMVGDQECTVTTADIFELTRKM
jgi:hypothetical protein